MVLIEGRSSVLGGVTDLKGCYMEVDDEKLRKFAKWTSDLGLELVDTQATVADLQTKLEDIVMMCDHLVDALCEILPKRQTEPVSLLQDPPSDGPARDPALSPGETRDIETP